MPVASVVGELLDTLNEGLSILLLNPWRCSGVCLLQVATLAIAAVLAAMSAAAFLAQFRIRRRLAEPDIGDERLLSLFARAVSLAGGRAPQIRIAAPGKTEVYTAGLLLPVIVVARDIAAALTDDELNVVLLHEIAHVRRRDNLRRFAGIHIGLLGGFAAVESFTLKKTFVDHAFRFDIIPALALGVIFVGVVLAVRKSLAGAVEYLREIACDDSAVAVFGDPLVVAAAILRVWRMQQGRRQALHGHHFLGHDSIERRVGRLLDARYAAHARHLAIARVAGLAVPLLLAAALLSV